LDLYPDSTYDPTRFERACNTVDTCICRMHNQKLQTLLIKRSEEPYINEWAIPGGFVDIRDMESLDEASYRELEEETGVTGIPVKQLRTMGESDRDPRWRLISTVYYALVSRVVIDKTTIEAGDDASEYKWAYVDDIINGHEEIAFDHRIIIGILLDQLKREITHTPLAFELVSDKYTWSELQSVYETILDKSLLSPNFRRSIKGTYQIQRLDSTRNTTKGTRGRTPTLYKYIGKKEMF
jgi:8-oxo-dGTP diphosphatase